MHVAPIDLRPFREGDDVDRRAVAALFDTAGRGSGFVAVTGHGIDPELLDEMMSVTTAFFDAPPEEKMRYYVEDRVANRGYAPEGTEALAYSLGEADLPPDLFEAFNVGRELNEAQLADPYFATYRDRYFAPNVWPTPEMRSTWLEYWAAVEQVASDIMAVAAIALGLNEDHFVPSLDKSISVMRANNYQRRPSAPAPEAGQMRMGAHTDYGSITVLLADSVPGLQIRDDDGAWQDVLPPDGGFLVNLGDLLAEWTNDRWRSTLHRVVPPAGTSVDPVRRRSIAWFQQPNWDAEIACLPTCCDESNPPRYGKVTSGDHLLAKLMGPRLLQPSEKSSAYLATD
ncbi:isopenicillin N synthase family dioxygenase [Ilumatobacter sp.]|uniref:isopenicillin N synthase family dioxygenase n=1 Tax=Ilumatobacter sp. TaxID=1967498 RepID=UPI003C36F1DA